MAFKLILFQAVIFHRYHAIACQFDHEYFVLTVFFYQQQGIAGNAQAAQKHGADSDKRR